MSRTGDQQLEQPALLLALGLRCGHMGLSWDADMDTRVFLGLPVRQPQARQLGLFQVLIWANLWASACLCPPLLQICTKGQVLPLGGLHNAKSLESSNLVSLRLWSGAETALEF